MARVFVLILCMNGYTFGTEYVWRSQDSLPELALLPLDFGTKLQVIRLSQTIPPNLEKCKMIICNFYDFLFRKLCACRAKYY